MVTPQRLKVAPPEDPLAGLGIVTDGVVRVDVVLRLGVAGRRRAPVRVQGLAEPPLGIFRHHAPLPLVRR